MRWSGVDNADMGNFQLKNVTEQIGKRNDLSNFAAKVHQQIRCHIVPSRVRQGLAGTYTVQRRTLAGLKSAHFMPDIVH